MGFRTLLTAAIKDTGAALSVFRKKIDPSDQIKATN
jgi:hypothetical protein